tara:strand:- start:3752 stop:4951 length:1200 start_codon:yes stop_codon:yes gene_type:complete
MTNVKLYNGLQNLFIFLLLFCLSVLYKVDNFPGIRPLYTIGLIILFILIILEFYNISRIKKVILSWLSLSPLLLLLIYIFLVSLNGTERTFKDSLYLLFYLLLLPSLFLSKIHKGNLESVLKIIIYFSVFSAIIAIFVLFNLIEYEKGEYKLIQNFWTPYRLHGIIGQPTAFGGLIGMSIILLSYLSYLNKKSYSLVWIILLIALIGSGSRNAIFSLSIAYLFISIITNRLKLNLKFIIFSIITIYAILYFELYLYFSDRVINFQSENNRIFIWGQVINLIFDNSNDLWSFVFGNGAGELVLVYRAAFNTPLHILYDYGLFGFIIYITCFVLSLYIGCKRLYSSRLIFYKYGLMLLIYGFVFNLFISSFLSPFFSFQVFSFIFGMLILATPIKLIREIK